MPPVHPLSTGRVRQVGPPSQAMQSASASNSCTRQPAASIAARGRPQTTAAPSASNNSAAAGEKSGVDFWTSQLDAKARTLGVPCYELLGGKVRDRIRVYWSHCGTWRINLPQHYGNPITDLAGVRDLGAEVRAKGFTALKTNVFRRDGGALRGWLPEP